MPERNNWSNKDNRSDSPEIRESNDYEVPDFNTSRGEPSKNRYEQRTNEMWHHHGAGGDTDINKRQIKGSQFQFPPNNQLMGFPTDEQIQQTFHFPNEMGFQQIEEQKFQRKNKNFKGRTIQNSKF